MNILIFVLATVAVTFTATIDTTPPASKSSGVRAEVPSEALNLTVLIVNDGFSLKAAGGNIAPGCQGPGAGIAIPLKNGKYDLEALTACASSPQERISGLRGREPGLHHRQLRDRLPDDHRRHRCTASRRRKATRLFENVNFKVPK